MSLKISVGAVFATAPLRMGEEKDHAKTVCSLYKLFNALQVVKSYEVWRYIDGWLFWSEKYSSVLKRIFK